MSANIKASVDGTQAIIGVGGVDQMTVSNAGVVTANSFVGLNSSSVTATGSTTARTLANRFADVVNVKDFGAVGDGVADDYAAFNTAINALNAEGGKIIVPNGSYKLNTEPTWGTKSLYWDISTGCIFSGAGTGFGKFPYMETNAGQMAVGPWIQSKTTQIGGAASNGGIAAFNVEMLQPSSATTMQSVAGYFGAAGSSASTGANVWALNTLIRADSGAKGTYQCIEVDVDTFSSAAVTKGISISGGGNVNATVGLEVNCLPTRFWDRGVHVLQAQDGIVITPITNGRGIVIGTVPPITSTAFSARQFNNLSDVLLLQRQTDTSPSGYFLRCVNANNNANLVLLDTIGNLQLAGIVLSAQLVVKQNATPVAVGEFAFGSTNQSTVGVAGTANPLPATPRGYLIAYDGPTKVVIPYYNA